MMIMFINAQWLIYIPNLIITVELIKPRDAVIDRHAELVPAGKGVLLVLVLVNARWV
jgi:hypothetical protein